MGVEYPSKPINRQEQYLAKIAGQAVEIPAEPITREEAYLDYIAKHGGGGGGGTNDYEELLNLPKINDVTLKGNKSAEDFGLADKTTVDNILNGTDIDSFADVETALADKADKSSVKNEFIGTTAQWNALTTAQKKAYDTYQITDDYTGGGGSLPDYSTTEQKTGQKWIDGSDIYFRVIELQSETSVGSNQWLSTEDIGGKCALQVYGLLENNSTGNVFPMGGGFTSGTLEVLNVRVAAATINKVIVYYTKA